MEAHLVLAILNHFILLSNMIFFYTAVEYWTEKLQNDLALLRRFSKQFIFEGLSITLGFSFFYINGIYIHQTNSNKAGLFESSFFWVRVNLTSLFISKEEIT